MIAATTVDSQNFFEEFHEAPLLMRLPFLSPTSKQFAQLGTQMAGLNDRRATIQNAKVAVLYQAIEPPVINGLRKPMKPGGYQDSGADIAFALQSQPNIILLTPHPNPDPRNQSHWSFPDTETGILSALSKGATHLWANTILFASHPLQASRVAEFEDDVKVIGQSPLMVEQFDDKEYVNDLLRKDGRFTMPKGWTVESEADLKALIDRSELLWPVVGKPIRGRGSYGVKVCHDVKELWDHVRVLFKDSPRVMLEEYLAGKEATITVFSTLDKEDYWASPIVLRFNHEDGVAPFNSIVAVTSNSRVITPEEFQKDVHYQNAARECEEVARLLKVTAPIRVDVRRFKDESKFALFDINMKPNMTGPGRPGREDQASLILLSVEGLGWDYGRLLRYMINSSKTLKELRSMKV